MLCINTTEINNYIKKNDTLKNYEVNLDAIEFNIDNLKEIFMKDIIKHTNINVKNIYISEIDIFHKILGDIFSGKDKKFLCYYIYNIRNKFKQNKKNIININFDNLIDKYLTDIIKNIDIDIYNKYIIDKNQYGNINHKKILILIDKYLYPIEKENSGVFNYMYLSYKHHITNTNFLSLFY